MGFSTQSLSKIGHLLSDDQNRAWEVWDEPPASLANNTIVAFRLFFPTSELGVRPEQRIQKAWKNVIHIEAGPPGKITVLTLIVTSGEPELSHESEPSFRLASFDIGEGRHAQLIAHGEPENNFPDFIKGYVAEAVARTQSKGVNLPDQAYGYFLGQEDGCRYLFTARLACRL
jgi:hypothetical protein